MPQISTYLSFNGDCAQAMQFYQRVLGGKLELMTFGQSPMAGETAPEDSDKVMHACLTVDGQAIMGSDSPACYPYEGKKGVSIGLVYPTVDEARRVFEALAEGGHIGMPLEKTFWAEIFGMVVDRHGTSWLINGGEMAA